MPLLPPRTPEREEIITVELAVASKSSAADKLSTDQPQGRVLLLEDRPDFRQVIQDYLESRLYQVTSVESGIEGLRKIMEGRFDLIICDMMMPNMGGEMFYWAVTRVRPGTRNQFLFFTGHKNNSRMDFFFRRVHATVLFKPFSLSALDAAIKEVAHKAARQITLNNAPQYPNQRARKIG